MNRLSITLESYLDTINEIWQEHHAVRSKDIAARLKVQPATVTSALKALKTLGYIDYQPYGVISMTEYGMRHANGILHKHETIATFYVKVLGLKAKTANDEACKAEHILTDEIVKRLDWLTRTLETNKENATHPRKGKLD